jgi:hypothetical protein
MDMREEIRAAFRDQAEACRRMGSPFNGLICDLLGERLSPESRFGELIDAWQGHPAADALALRAAGALHALARSGRVPALTAHYARPEQPDPDALWQVIAGALQDHADMLCAYLDGPPQTNEVGRSAVLLGAALHVSARTHLPLCWYEIGASAGLNLRFDRYRYELGAAGFWGQAASWAIRSNWEGELPSLAQAFTIAERAGCDLQPLDPSLAEHRERLLSYIWPDQTERLERPTAALDTAARGGTRVVCEPGAEAGSRSRAGAYSGVAVLGARGARRRQASDAQRWSQCDCADPGCVVLDGGRRQLGQCSAAAHGVARW